MSFLHNINFRQLLLIFCVFTVGIFLLNSALAAYLMERLDQETIQRRSEQQRLIAMKDLESDLGFASREMAHQVLAESPAAAAEQATDFTEKRDNLAAHIADITQTASTSANKKQLMQSIQANLTVFMEDLNKVSTAVTSGNRTLAMQIVDESEELEDKIIHQVHEYSKLTEQAIAYHNANVNNYKAMFYTLLATLTSLMVLVAWVLFHRLQNHMKTIAGSVTQVAQAQTAVSTHVQTVNATISEEASAVHEVAASMEEFAKTVQHIAQRVEDTARNTENIRTMVNGAHGGMEKLKGCTNKITEMLKVIQGISDQTNLLALNAAIEAARAGDAGRGFAVVADEVRKLARHSTTSASEIEQSIKQLGQEVTSLGASLDEIRAAILLIDNQASEISSATNQQSASMGQINIAVERMNHNMVEIGRAMEQTRTSTTSMGGACTHLTTQISQ
ncbi:MAG: hypothetical protein EBR79_02490 [Proteobacteria bacterium]|nr:hypothetical protein [Pseudomonadota bacterium]NBX85730.1 hypothetical protein [Pseudomonadota bacterium]